MDPYLEGDLWQEFHETLAGAIRAQLLRRLPPRYVALLAKRYVMYYIVTEPVAEMLGPLPEEVPLLSVDYSALPPPPPLSAEDAAWVRKKVTGGE
jgi:hypothetical protein